MTPLTAVSLLQRASNDHLVTEPFPHLVIEDALPAAYYDDLARTLPSDEALRGDRPWQANTYYRIAAATSLDAANPVALPAPWRDFIAYHVSPAFYADVLRVFAPALASYAATVTGHFGAPLHQLRAGPRLTEASDAYDAQLDCQLVHTSPPQRTDRPAGPHVDREVTLWAGLFYMRHPADDSVGGDLILYRFRDRAQPAYWKNRRISDSLVEPVQVIPYRANTLVMFLQSPHSVHGVSPRLPTAWGRNYVNLLCEFPFRVFDLNGRRVHMDRFPD
jgi:hypothetical protein